MDADGLNTFATFTELYQYCYYVASVVGLVCIRIFGYSSPAAEKLAEETGIAFQLTNILRDVREDAERGRVYIPCDDLKGCGTTAVELAHVKTGRELTERSGWRWPALRGAHVPTTNPQIGCCP